MLEDHPDLSRRFKEFAEKDKAEIHRLIRARAPGQIHTVAAIYDEIIAIIRDETLIPDSVFDEESYAYQASWDDWGRNYGPEPRHLDAGGSPAEDPQRQREANLLIERAATRTEALAALKAIGSQGEGIHLEHKRTDELSHFERFLKIFQEFPEDWTPSRDIPDNPTTRKTAGDEASYIENAQARAWATLFNYRYRLLLTCLAHSFRLQRLAKAGEPNLRGMVMHRAFGEMYNIKTIAQIIVGLDRHKEGTAGDGPRLAGPPFEMPYTLTLPDAEADAWLLHQEFLQGAIDVEDLLLEKAAGAGRDYLIALKDLDRRAIAAIDALLQGQGSRRK
jgi:hypothetical protein